MQRTTEGGWQNSSRTSEVHGGILTEPQQVSHHGHQGLQNTTNTKNTPRGSETPKPTLRVPKHQKSVEDTFRGHQNTKTSQKTSKTTKTTKTTLKTTKTTKTTPKTTKTTKTTLKTTKTA